MESGFASFRSLAGSVRQRQQIYLRGWTRSGLGGSDAWWDIIRGLLPLKKVSSEVGIEQGPVISPLLANIYPALQVWIRGPIVY